MPQDRSTQLRPWALKAQSGLGGSSGFLSRRHQERRMLCFSILMQSEQPIGAHPVDWRMQRAGRALGVTKVWYETPLIWLYTTSTIPQTYSSHWVTIYASILYSIPEPEVYDVLQLVAPLLPSPTKVIGMSPRKEEIRLKRDIWYRSHRNTSLLFKNANLCNMPSCI